MMRHSVLLNLMAPLADYVAISSAAETAGVDGVFVVEEHREPFVTLGAIAAATTRIGLGSYIANAYARSPWLTAMSALEVDELSGGRFVLGLGSGNRHLNDRMHGADSSRPLAKMREYVPLVRAMIAARAGELVDQEGMVHRAQWRAWQNPTTPMMPVLVAAAGPKMIELAGTLSDGVAVGILVSPEHLQQVVQPLARRAAASAGRDSEALRFPMAAYVSVDRDVERARLTTRKAICRLFHPVPHPYYEYLLRAQGFGSAADALVDLVPQGQVQEAMTHIDDAIIDDLTITGTPSSCAERMSAYEGIADEVLCINLRRAEPAAARLSEWDELFAMLALRF